MQMSYLVNDWKYQEDLPAKNCMREKQVLQDSGYVRGVKGPCCILHGILQGCTDTMLKVLKEIK